MSSKTDQLPDQTLETPAGAVMLFEVEERPPGWSRRDCDTTAEPMPTALADLLRQALARVPEHKRHAITLSAWIGDLGQVKLAAWWTGNRP